MNEDKPKYEGEPLPKADRQALLDLLALGDIAAMNEFCETRENSEHADYVRYAQSLLQNFDFQSLKKLLREDDA